MAKKKYNRKPTEDEEEPVPVVDENQVQEDPICALCQRPIPPDTPQSLHHLIPKLKGGRRGPTVLLHDLCHNEIHATLKESELARSYNTVEALRGHPHLEKFINWLAKKPPEFTARTLQSERRRKK